MHCCSLMPYDAPQQEIVLEYPLDAPILAPSSWHPALLQVVLQCCPVSEDLVGPAVQLGGTYRQPCNFIGFIPLSMQYTLHTVGKWLHIRQRKGDTVYYAWTHIHRKVHPSYTIFHRVYWLSGGQHAVSYVLTSRDPAVRQPLCWEMNGSFLWICIIALVTMYHVDSLLWCPNTNRWKAEQQVFLFDNYIFRTTLH